MVQSTESGAPVADWQPMADIGGASVASAGAPPLTPVWQWPSAWRCPMLGMCLSSGEQRRLFKQPGKTRHMGSYDLHQALMMATDDENSVSRRIERLLRRKYYRTALETGRLTPEAFMDFWRRGWQGSEAWGLFYVAAARCDLKEEWRREIYGCVHMAAHGASVDLMAARQDAARQRQANAKLARTVRKLRDQLTYRKQQPRRQTPVLVRSGADQGELAVPESAAPPAIRLALAGDSGRDRLEQEVRRLEREKRQLEIRYFEIQSQNAQLADEVRSLIGRMTELIRCRDNCPAEGRPGFVCPRRVLIVGGMTKLQHLYRELVETVGGELDYHDGYLRQAGDNLQARIGRSDLVICPANCNSHNACKRVKGICKRLNKRLHILPSASLSAITAALQGDVAIGAESGRVSQETVN